MKIEYKLSNKKSLTPDNKLCTIKTKLQQIDHEEYICFSASEKEIYFLCCMFGAIANALATYL